MFEARDRFGSAYAEAGLLCAPSVSYMYTVSEIAAELALETPGIDMLETASLSRGPMQGAGVSVGSTSSIFELYRHGQKYLWDKQLIEHPKNQGYEVSAPEFLTPVFCLPWGGTSLPVIYERDPRVRYCRSLVGFYDNPAMKMVLQLGEKWENEYKDLPKQQQDAVIAQIVGSTTPSMPPRERTTMNRSVDFALGRGQLASVRAVVNSITPYITTGAHSDGSGAEAARWRDETRRLRLGLSGVRPPVPVGLSRTARPCARTRHHQLMAPTLTFVRCPPRGSKASLGAARREA